MYVIDGMVIKVGFQCSPSTDPVNRIIFGSRRNFQTTLSRVVGGPIFGSLYLDKLPASSD